MHILVPIRAGGRSLVLLLAAVLILAACDDGDVANALPAAAPLPQVGFRVAQPQTVSLTAELPGRTVAFRRAEVRPQVDGIIQERLFEEGATVEAGQPLYQIDSSLFEAIVRAAEANIARTQASENASSTKLERFRVLLGRNAISQQEFDDMLAEHAANQADVAVAEAELEKARINLNYTTVTAPISGTIGRSTITAGSLVTANQEEALATITQLDPIYVDVTRASSEVLRTRQAIEAGEITVSRAGEVPVTLKVDAEGTPYPHDGRLQFSEVLVNETTGSVTLRAVFPNPEQNLMPGLFVRAIVGLGDIEGAFLVPQAALVRDNNGQPFVWLIGAEDMVSRQPVTVRRAQGESWVVTGGLSAGDRIVVDGLQRVRSDMQVTPVPLDGQDDAPQTADGASS